MDPRPVDDKPAPAPDPRPSNPFVTRTIESAYLLAPPSQFLGLQVITHAFIPPDFAALPAHVVIYHTGPELFWGPETISQDARIFGVGRIEYDDDAQKNVYVTLATDVTYSTAMLDFTVEVAKPQGIELA